jgi:hypothetical protein
LSADPLVTASVISGTAAGAGDGAGSGTAPRLKST